MPCSRTNWEYRYVPVSVERPESEFVELLDELGAEGWELAAVVSLPEPSAYRLVLKRPRSD